MILLVPPADPSQPAVLRLEYDELPPGSDIKREFAPSGVTITVPAGDVPPAALRAASFEAMRFAAGVSTVIMGLGVAAAVAAGELGRMDVRWRLAAMGLTAVIGLGLFALAWRGRYAAKVEALNEARRQATVLHVTPGRLLVETTGPLGSGSHELAKSRVVRVRVGSDSAGRAGDVSLRCLWLDRLGAPPLRLLIGREASELRWIAATVAQTLGVPVAAGRSGVFPLARS